MDAGRLKLEAGLRDLKMETGRNTFKV